MAFQPDHGAGNQSKPFWSTGRGRRKLAVSTFSNAILLLLSTPVLVYSQVLDCPPRISFETMSAGCKSGDTQGDIRTDGNTIIVTEAVTTPNPCYKIRGKVKIEGTDIVVRLEPENEGELCIQCVGEIIGKVSVSGLQSGMYSVRVELPERVVTTSIKILETQ